jgi:hypothetical protein
MSSFKVIFLGMFTTKGCKKRAYYRRPVYPRVNKSRMAGRIFIKFYIGQFY